MPVVLAVDEYHLDIRAGGDLIGRYYLAEVEVARDIAERFILFLGEDEMEFLAEDALQFAYDGVAAMQDAWLAAQKRKRKHRKAAEQSARRKDEEVPEPAASSPIGRVEAVRPERLQRTRPAASRPADAPPSELAKRIAAATRAEKTALEAAAAAQGSSEPIAPVQDSEPVVPAAFVVAETAASPLQSQVVEESIEPAQASAEPVKTSNGFHRDEPIALPGEVVEAPVVREPSKGPRVIPTVAFTSERLEPASPAVEEDDGVRFAPSGHHPAETSVGLLSRLRRQPKVPDNHTHKFRESGSGVGLVRRVCTECSYVSIGSGD